MTRDDILAAIDANRDRLRDFRVTELSLFGSYARGDAGPGSDIDFVVEFERTSFDGYMGLKEFLEELFDRRVDLVIKGAIKERLRDRILAEAVRAA
jgi:uncharacterized protein